MGGHLIEDKYYKLVYNTLKTNTKLKDPRVRLDIKLPHDKEWFEAINKYEPGDFKLQLIDKAGEVLETLSNWTLIQMPNCCGICVSTKVWVHGSYTKFGLGSLLNQWRVDIAREGGYSLLLCTDVDKNEAQRKVLNRNGWKTAHKFLNQRTSNVVNISVIGL